MQIFNIINRLKTVFQANTDSELADALGIKQPTISSWKSRETIDYALIITLCNKESVNLDWLFFGEGSMLKDETCSTSKEEDSRSTDRLLSIIESQQRTIEMLSKKIPDI